MTTAPAEPRAHSIRILVSLCALVTAALLLAVAFRPAEHIYDTPLTEDGYYALAVARNVAAGKGITIDGERLTNGFQPLFTMVEAGAYKLAGGDEVMAIRLTLGAAGLMHILAALLIGLIARDAWPAAPGLDGEGERRLRFALGTLLYIASPLIAGHAYNGLETGCVMLFYALAWRLAQTGADRTWVGLVAYGAVIGLMVLARIDAAFLALVLGLNELRKSWRLGFGTMLGRAIVLGGVALLVSSPWWIYNQLYFGSPMPTSGTAQQIWALEWQRFEDADRALRMAAIPWLFLGSFEFYRLCGSLGGSFDLCTVYYVPWPLGSGSVAFTAIGVARLIVLIAIAALFWRAVRRGTLRRDRAASDETQRETTRRTLEFAACFAIAMTGLVVYYTLSFVAYWFFYRYFAPVAVFACVFVAIAWSRVMLRGTAPWLQAALVVALAVQTGWIAYASQWGGGIGGNTVYHDQVALARKYVPQGERVAGGQTGTLGYFHDHVVNLDGKVNRDALAYQDHMWDYLRDQGIRWFIDWPHYVRKYLGVPLDDKDVPLKAANGWRFVAEQNYFYVYEYVGDAAGGETPK